MIVGPGVKKGFALSAKLHHEDQYPTIFELMGLKSPDFVEGKAVRELFSGEGR